MFFEEYFDSPCEREEIKDADKQEPSKQQQFGLCQRHKSQHGRHWQQNQTEHAVVYFYAEQIFLHFLSAFGQQPDETIQGSFGEKKASHQAQTGQIKGECLTDPEIDFIGGEKLVAVKGQNEVKNNIEAKGRMKNTEITFAKHPLKRGIICQRLKKLAQIFIEN